jgi:hypothetical protein
MCPGRPMQPFDIPIEGVRVVQRCIGDEDLLPMLPPLDVRVGHHDPILFLVPFPSIISALYTSVSGCMHT